MIVVYKRILLSLCILLLPCASFAQEKPVQKRANKTEVRADRAFIRGDIDRAMKLYEHADKRYGSGEAQGLDLRLKMARLYVLMQSPSQAIPYYDLVREASDTSLTVNDVCFYIDALRQTGRDQQAEIVARHYAFMSPYSRNQRYLNTLYSLSNLQRYYGKGDSDYAVKLMGKSSALPEYWLGKWDGDVFYAVSNSRIQDPLKIYYHQTQYYSTRASGNPAPLRSIPRELQSGPVAFSDDNRIMVATGISYRQQDRISNITGADGMFVTQLYYSVIDPRRDSWGAFEMLFEHQQGYNYAHPAFYNDGRSIVFSSDRPGGYGGMDLYIAHWNDAAGTWSDPLNMGAVVNTEGDEIFPRIMDGGLYFASNGLEGYGGYDNYKVNFGQNRVLPGSLYHYPWPINSVCNDFGIFIDGRTGYFVSDRRGFTGKDDIYTFDASTSPLNNLNAIGVSEEFSAMTGNLNLIHGLKAGGGKTMERDIHITPTYTAAREGEVMLSVYFDFNSSTVDPASQDAIRTLLANPALRDVSEFHILGYADELGTRQYNVRLSTRRAEAVAGFMRDNSTDLPALFVEGRGQLALTPQEYAEQVRRLGQRDSITIDYEIKRVSNGKYFTFEELKQINRSSRRVDIIVKKK
jgi:outer membrane protein OmpA-like peptidoglycan-associated protein